MTTFLILKKAPGDRDAEHYGVVILENPATDDEDEAAVIAATMRIALVAQTWDPNSTWAVHPIEHFDISPDVEVWAKRQGP